MQNERKNRGLDIAQSEGWPSLLRIPPKTLLMAVLGWLALAWAAFIVIDILGWINLRIIREHGPLWRLLFDNRHPIEWTQWLLLAFAIVSAAYLAGRLCIGKRTKVSRFFFLLAIGLGLMLIEDAGDPRHVIGEYLVGRYPVRVIGVELILPHRAIWDISYFAALAIVPLYALLRYGRDAWKSAQRRFCLYLASGVTLYALAAASSGFSDIHNFYVRAGAWIDAVFFSHRFPIPNDWTQPMAHFFLMDAPIEESVELLAAAMIFAAILAFASDMRSGWEHESTDTRPS